MAIDKPLGGLLNQDDFEMGPEGLLVAEEETPVGDSMLTELEDGGVEIDFFGKPAVTSTVPAELALKHNAPLIPVYGLRKPNGLDFEIIVHEPIPPTDPKTMTQAFNHDLEALVRQHMEQWFWVHRRWKPWFDLGVQPEDMPG